MLGGGPRFRYGEAELVQSVKFITQEGLYLKKGTGAEIPPKLKMSTK